MALPFNYTLTFKLQARRAPDQTLRESGHSPHYKTLIGRSCSGLLRVECTWDPVYSPFALVFGLRPAERAVTMSVCTKIQHAPTLQSPPTPPSSSPPPSRLRGRQPPERSMPPSVRGNYVNPHPDGDKPRPREAHAVACPVVCLVRLPRRRTPHCRARMRGKKKKHNITIQAQTALPVCSPGVRVQGSRWIRFGRCLKGRGRSIRAFMVAC